MTLNNNNELAFCCWWWWKNYFCGMFLICFPRKKNEKNGQEKTEKKNRNFKYFSGSHCSSFVLDDEGAIFVKFKWISTEHSLLWDVAILCGTECDQAFHDTCYLFKWMLTKINAVELDGNMYYFLSNTPPALFRCIWKIYINRKRGLHLKFKLLTFHKWLYGTL